MNESKKHDAFVMEMLNNQRRLQEYIFTLMYDRDRANDVLQQTNVAILKKEADFAPGTNFGAWACKVAYFEVLADRRRRHRDRHLFDDDLLQLIAETADRNFAGSDQRLDALTSCLERLNAEQRQLLHMRYSVGGSVSAIAGAAQKTPSAISSLLYRIRTLLVDCVDQQLTKASP